jgi:hypothetical protein
MADNIDDEYDEDAMRYEEERLAKIQRNRARLAALGLDKSKIGEQTDENGNIVPKQKKVKKKQSLDNNDRRSSQRLKSKEPISYTFTNTGVYSPTAVTNSAKKNNKRKRNETPVRKTPRRRRGYTANAVATPEQTSDETTTSGQIRTRSATKKSRVNYFETSMKEDIMDNMMKSDVQQPVIMFTQEVEASDDYYAYMSIIQSLSGIIEKEDITKCTHLISYEMKRTVKHLCALGLNVMAVHPDWLKSSVAFGTWVDEYEYLVVFRAGEKMRQAVANAQIKGVFDNHSFFVTENVTPKKPLLEKIIECNGGNVIQDLSADSVPTTETFHIITSPEDISKISDIPKEATVHSAEFILYSVYSQEIDLEKHAYSLYVTEKTNQ